jgi:hypothetical protein
MSHFMKFALGFVGACVIVWSLGCSKETPPAEPANSTTEAAPAADTAAPQPQQTQSAAEGEAAAPAGGEQAASAEIQAALAALSADDRALAMQQKICPVSGEALGGMGTPIKVSVAGHEVLICCEHCEQPLRDDPSQYLAKIGLQPAVDAAAK